MQLRSIEIRDFRKLGHARIEGLGDGLTVIVGDNETGKSTVLAALRAVLFERHRVGGKVVEAMLPYGQNVRPEVAIAFDLKGGRYTLRKAFNQRQEAELIEPGGRRLMGDEVEDRLAELFSFTPPGRGKSKRDEHQGLYGLLWVDQGHSHRSLGVGGGKDTLASALEGEVGQVLGGERGRTLLAAAAERKERFWGKNDKPRGEYRALSDEIDRLKTRRAKLTEELAEHDGKVAALAGIEEALARHKREERLPKAIEKVRIAKEAMSRAAEGERALGEAAARLTRCDQDRTHALERRQRRADMIGKAEAAATDLARAQQQATEARALLARQQALAEADERRLALARTAGRSAGERLDVLQRAADRQRRSEALRALETQLNEAERCAARRREILAGTQAGSPVGAKEIAELEALQRALDQARSRLEAASVQIVFKPDGQREIALDGASVPPGQPVLLSRDAVLTLEGFGRLSVRPGGGVELLARTSEDAARRLNERLRALGLASVAEGRSVLARKTEAEFEAASLAKLLSVLAPSGLEALRQSVEAERAALARMLLEGTQAQGQVDAAAIDAARRAKDDAADQHSAAEANARASGLAREHAARDLAVADDRVAAAQIQHEARVAELFSAREQASDEHLHQRLDEADRAFERAQADAAQAQAALRHIDPEVARLDLDRAERTEATIRGDLAKLAGDKRDLDVELGVLGRAGLGEELSELDGRIERLERDKAATDLEAQASRLLLSTLTDAQRESKDRWLGPVRERVTPYLKFLDPDSDIVLNDQTFEIEGIVRRGVSEPFNALSTGAREQVAVITRLALADILRASGQPSALILDDALVNTDEGRLERMQRVLQTAAKSLQVLVLTCRERDFMGLGDVKRL